MRRLPHLLSFPLLPFSTVALCPLFDFLPTTLQAVLTVPTCDVHIFPVSLHQLVGPAYLQPSTLHGRADPCVWHCTLVTDFVQTQTKLPYDTREHGLSKKKKIIHIEGTRKALRGTNLH